MYVFFKMCVCVCDWPITTMGQPGSSRAEQQGITDGFFSACWCSESGGGKKVAWREIEWSECVFVCMWESRRAGQSEESLLAVPFKSDLEAVSVVTYCRSAVQSLSKSSDLHPHEKTEWTASCHKLKAGISHFNSSQWLQHRLLFQMKIFFFFDYIS